MNLCTVILVLSSAFLFTECTSKTGVQMRLTKKGIQYVIDVGKKILEAELMKKTIDASGRGGNAEYKVSGMRISQVYFTNPKLTPVPHQGITAQFPGISLKARGKVWYKVKKGWFKFSDTVDLSIAVSGVYITSTLQLTKTPDGHPNIAISACQSNVGSVDLKFHGGIKAFIYNLFKGLLEDKIKERLNDMLCQLIRKEVDEKARPELATFPVLKKLDDWAEIDYRLTQSPVFTKYYMDAFFKGEFKSASTHKESGLVPPTFPVTSDHDKMLYFWITNYTINTAGEVYQGSNQFNIELKAWDKEVPEDIRKNLNTNKFKLVIPNLVGYPDLPMSVRLVSYKASKVVINEGNLHLFLYAHATFSLKYNNGTIFEAFTLQFDIDTTAMVQVKSERIGGKITEFHYNAKVLTSNIGKINTPLDNEFFKIIVETTIISRANPHLQKGFPLPQLDNVAFHNIDVQLQKGVIRIGSDILYTKTNRWPMNAS